MIEGMLWAVGITFAVLLLSAPRLPYVPPAAPSPMRWQEIAIGTAIYAAVAAIAILLAPL